MINFFKKHKHLYAMLMPVALGLLLFAICLPSIYGPITFREADALANIFHSHAWGLRTIAVLIMCVILVITFQVIRFVGGLKIATIASIVTMGVFAGGVYLKNIPTAQERALPDIITDVRLFDQEPQTIYFDISNLNAALFYTTPAYPIADFSTRPTGNHHFWLVVPAESADTLQVPNGYYIANQLGNDYYTAVDLGLQENAP